MSKIHQLVPGALRLAAVIAAFVASTLFLGQGDPAGALMAFAVIYLAMETGLERRLDERRRRGASCAADEGPRGSGCAASE